MRYWNTYYLVDFLTSSIVTSFEAISDSMAFAVLRKIIEKNDKLKMLDSAYCLVKHGGRFVADSMSDISPALDYSDDELLSNFKAEDVKLSDGFSIVVLPEDISASLMDNY